MNKGAKALLITAKNTFLMDMIHKKTNTCITNFTQESHDFPLSNTDQHRSTQPRLAPITPISNNEETTPSSDEEVGAMFFRTL